MCDNCSCSFCAHCQPDDINHETLDIIFWCTLKNDNVYGSSSCPEFLSFFK